MDYKLELIVVPVSDVERSKSFYIEKAGFDLNSDYSAGDDFRVVQLNPPGSPCSIALMRNLERSGGVKGLHLIVTDIGAARAELSSHGLDISEPFHFEEGQQMSGVDPNHTDYGSFLSFNDPDGNGWMVQEVGYSKS